MKLNNRGWTMNSMMIYSSILLFFFILAIFLIIYFSSRVKMSPLNPNYNQSVSYPIEDEESEQKDNSSYYADIEKSMEEATIIYVTNYYPNTIAPDETIMITINTLVKKNLLEEPSDLDANTKCTGYVLVSTDLEEKPEADAYLSCANYSTPGYELYE